VISASRDPSARPFTFFSVFKWERRKGWDLLLDAYWSEFDETDTGKVLLRIRSYKPAWEAGPAKISEWIERYARQARYTDS